MGAANESLNRLARYCLDLAELLGMNRVVPVVIFLRPGNYSQELVLATGQMTYLSFRYLVCDLGRLPVDDYLDSRNVVSRILLPLMQYARERRVEVCLRALEGLVELEPNQDKCLKYVDFSTRYANLSAADRAELKSRLTQSKNTEAIMGGIFAQGHPIRPGVKIRRGRVGIDVENPKNSGFGFIECHPGSPENRHQPGGNTSPLGAADKSLSLEAPASPPALGRQPLFQSGQKNDGFAMFLLILPCCKPLCRPL